MFLPKEDRAYKANKFLKERHYRFVCLRAFNVESLLQHSHTSKSQAPVEVVVVLAVVRVSRGQFEPAALVLPDVKGCKVSERLTGEVAKDHVVE